MKIDILRSTNPALSLSSQTEDLVDFHPFYGNPVPLELVSPRNAAAVRTFDPAVDKALSRSKSAPPLALERAKEDCEGRSKTKELLQTRLSSSYNEEGGSQYHYCDPSNTNSDASTSNYYYYNNNTSSDGSSSPSIDEDPEDNIMCDPNLKRLFTPGSASLHLHTPAPTRPSPSVSLSGRTTGHSTNNEGSEREEVASFLHPVDTITNNKRSSSSLNTAEGTPYSQNSGGVLVLRPNPVKTVPPIVQGVVASGVVAPAHRLATGSFTSTHSSPFLIDQRQQEEQEEVDPVELIRSVASKPVVPTQVQKSKKSFPSDPWCKVAEERARKEKRKKERLADLRRREEIQCNFPDYCTMASASGRNTEEPDQGRVEDRENTGPNRNQDTSSTTRQEQSQQQYARISSVRSSSSSIPPPKRSEHRMMGGGDDEGAGAGPRSIQSTPVFERLVTDEVREIQAYTRMVENQSVELEKLRTYQKDLEKRLQDESRLQEQLEATLELREREWLERYGALEAEIKRLNNVVKAEENKNKLLLDQIRKKDQDIQGMLKKKYDNEVGPGARTARSLRGVQDPRAERQHSSSKGLTEARVSGTDLHRSPADYLKSLGSAEKVRERNTRHLLMDFFGL
ncbi:hypothetical protein ACA910_014447 [Epithemia clementina (nom. ined.)]